MKPDPIKLVSQFFIIFTLAFCIISCSKDKHIFIKLDNTHLKDTPPGFWLNIFELNYSQDAIRLKKQIMNKLRSEGELLDEYNYNDGPNVVKTFLWKYCGLNIKEQYYNGGIWEGPKVIPFQEYSNGGWNTWFTI